MYGGHPGPGGDGGHHGTPLRRDPGKRLEARRCGTVLPAYDLRINEGADPDVRRDMTAFFSRIIPHRGEWRHGEGNSDAHIKASLMGPSLFVIVEDGEPRLGTWQSVYLYEGDGPRSRSIWVQWLPASENA